MDLSVYAEIYLQIFGVATHNCCNCRLNNYFVWLQVTLLKAGTFEVMMVHLACLFDSKNNTMLFVNGSIFQRTPATFVSYT